jgi:hypothetical protein
VKFSELFGDKKTLLIDMQLPVSAQTSTSRMSSQTSVYVGATVYGVLVFVGAALLGFVVLPFLGVKSGLFAIDADSYAFFSLLTLKGVPFLVVLSILSSLLYQRVSERQLGFRATLLAVNAFLAWMVGASIALAILG